MRWKDVKGYEELFQISDTGELRSKRTNKILAKHITRKGYVTISTKIGGRKGQNKCFRVHRLVAEAFVEKPVRIEILEVNHKDLNRSNNVYTNLEWVTRSDNVKHSYDNNPISKSSRRGEENPQSKLSEELVKMIRERYVPRCPVNGGSAIARELGISTTHVNEIASGKHWKHIEE